MAPVRARRACDMSFASVQPDVSSQLRRFAEERSLQLLLVMFVSQDPTFTRQLLIMANSLSLQAGWYATP